MKLTRHIGVLLPITIFALAILIYGAGYLLPNRTQVERSTYIDVDPEVVYGLMNDLRQFNQWAPWRERDPNTEYRVEQPGRGLGATLHWQSEDSAVGAGQLAIIDAQPHNKLRMLLEYDGGERAVLAWRLEPLEGGTHIDWTLDAEHGEDPVSRYRGLLTARWLKTTFEPGLDRLRRLSERQPSLPTTNVVIEEIGYQVGNQSFTGYMAYDQSRQNRPGVLIVGEWRGHNDSMRQRAEQLAELGYVAFVQDIDDARPPGGDDKQAGDPEEIGRLTREAKENFEVARQQFIVALDLLKQHPSINPGHIAAIGYDFGGSLVLNMAREGVDLDGVVSFHGSLMSMDRRYADAPGGRASAESFEGKAQQSAVKASILVLNGADDPRVPPEQRRAFIEEMDAAGVDYEFINYPGAMHTFTNPAAETYNAEADNQSWQRMQTFLTRIFR